MRASTLLIASSLKLSKSLRVPAIIAAISLISSSFMPLVVTAGVPRRIPLVTKGEAGSKGIVFLLHVILTSSRMFFSVFS